MYRVDILTICVVFYHLYIYHLLHRIYCYYLVRIWTSSVLDLMI